MTPLVLVHGLMGGSAQWDLQLKALSDHFGVTALDLPGFGRNRHLPAISRIDELADWVLSALRDKGIEQYHLLGHSMGGMIVQEIARMDPGGVQRLILYATGAIGVLPGRFETIDESKARVQSNGVKDTASRIAATWFWKNEQATNFKACERLAQMASMEAIQAGLDAMKNWSGTENLSALPQETLIICGDRDRTYSWEQTSLLWSSIPNASLSVIPGCAHAVHLEKPELFTSVLVDYLL
ncbi:alpha/beta fold hydrolase [uncultured Ruegeria sp.]|uniref:alpha/beta fold hydrolase n=1 Tax=uncultured Ruegeria sp. TaxID=259304 RepID=UPI002639C787|nr:alpha/beta fold hydrolase [uncultured Ruegeria sp.]